MDTRERDNLEKRYRHLYWYLNELQLVGFPANDPEYKAVVKEMDNLAKRLGYTPEA